MPLILPGNVASATAGAYEVANSCRFNDGDSPRLHKTPGGAGNRRTFTISLWVKRCALGANIYMFDSRVDGSDNAPLQFDSSDRLYFRTKVGGTSYDFTTNRVFRDCSAWFHICIKYDNTQGTEGDRVKIYINGIQETSFATDNYPAQNADTTVNNTTEHAVGSEGGGASFFDGYIAEFCLIDGSALAPTSFGEFDEDSPTIWKPIDVSGLTFGTNGFYLDFEASGNLGNDANGGTDLTEVNIAATDQSTDTPTLNYATWNSAQPALSNTSFSEGNLTFASDGSGSGQLAAVSTMAASTGKWYGEFKMTAESTTAGSYPYIGPVGTSYFTSTYIGAADLDGVGFNSNEAVYSNGDEIDSGVTNIAEGNIVGVAVDVTNKKVYFHVNGSYIASQDPAAGSNGYTLPTTEEGFYSFMCSVYGVSGTWEANFGSPSFSISSGNADGDGSGNFEYAVPSGYYALNSKNLAEYG